MKLETFEECLDLCDRTPNCIAVAKGSLSCQLKAALGESIYTGSSDFASARVLTNSPPATEPTPLSCPLSDGITYTASSGDSYLIA